MSDIGKQEERVEETVAGKIGSIQSEQTLLRRYLYKLGSNLFFLVLGIVSQSLVVRSLGPADYGSFGFLTSFFWQAIGFLSLGSSSALYTKLSERQGEKRLIGFYALVLGAMLVILLSITGAVQLLGFSDALWPGQPALLVFFGLLWALLRFGNDVTNQIYDALGLTVTSESANTISRLMGVALLFLLFMANLLTLRNYFLCQLVMPLGVTAYLSFRLASAAPSARAWLPVAAEVRGYAGEFYRFCAPLFWFTLFAMLEGMADRWLLQRFSGGAEQGFYSFSYQIGSICFLFGAAMVPLAGREIAAAHGQGGREAVATTFTSFAPRLYALIAYFACFLAVQAGTIIALFGNPSYADAMPSVALMCLYSMHQVYGQLNAAVFFASDLNRAYRNIGLLLMPIGILLSFATLGPTSFGLFQLGAFGLALKMVLMQLLSVNVQLAVLTKQLRRRYPPFIFGQLVPPVLLTGLAWLSSVAGRHVAGELPALAAFLLSGSLYTLLALALLIVWPSLFGMRRDQVVSSARRLWAIVLRL